MEKIILINNVDTFYNKIWYMKLLSKLHVKIGINYKNRIYYNSSEKHSNDLNIVLRMLDIININKRKEKYNLIYDYACEYLDNEFINNNWCNFKNNMCECNRNKPKEYQTGSCCTRTLTRETCKYFDNSKKRCSIKCLGCKLFVCNYLRKKGIKYTSNNVPYLKYFLSLRQKLISNYTFFKTQEDIINKWLKFYKLP